jgi:membrane protease YdiL (CAAX protease family)
MRFSRRVTRDEAAQPEAVSMPAPMPAPAPMRAPAPTASPGAAPAAASGAERPTVPKAVPSAAWPAVGGLGGEPARADLRAEVWLVLGVSVGAAAVFAALNLVGRLLEPVPLAATTATLNGSYAPGRPWLDLALQLASIFFLMLPALLAVHLLRRAGTAPAAVGLDTGRWPRDLRWGALLAAVIGIPGLLLYLAAHALGLSAIVVPEDLPPVWWRIPVLVLSAAGNAVLEEVVVVAYLVTRLGQLRWRPNPALLASALLRGSYHLYQGFGAFVGNAVMGLLFGRVFQRTGRVLPLVIAHTLLDAVAFVGYAALHGRVSWLP